MKRLLDDPRLAGELRTDLLRSRSAGQDYQTAAKLLQLKAAFSDTAPAAPARETTFNGSAKQTLASGLHPSWKLAVLAALGGGAGLFTYSASVQPHVSSETPHVTLNAPPPAAASVTRPTSAVQPAPAAAPSMAQADTAPTATPASAPPPAAIGSASARRPSESNSSRREIAQLVRMRALLERDPAAAYRLAQRAEREFPRGILAQERQALAIVALARSGDRERAHTQARQFFARYPQSPLRESIEAALQR